jgi:haloalkane dehalogenase
MTTSAIDAVRTPEDRFASLPGYPYEPRYRTREDGLRLAFVDEGERAAPPVVLVHGQPTWGYLWRRLVDPLTHAGLRVVVPDHLGFGRSDKPVDLAAYSYADHARNLSDLLDHLDLEAATMVVHDWGGPIGLRVAVERPDRVARMVIMDSGLLSGRQRMGSTWLAFRDYVRRTPELPVGQLVSAGCHRPPAPEVAAAYDAPFPDARSQGGVHAFPELVPTEPDAPEAEDHRRVWERLAADERPLLALWAAHDVVFPVERGRRFLETIGAPEPRLVEGAGHFLQEDKGPAVAAEITGWLREEGVL